MMIELDQPNPHLDETDLLDRSYRRRSPEIQQIDKQIAAAKAEIAAAQVEIDAAETLAGCRESRARAQGGTVSG